MRSPPDAVPDGFLTGVRTTAKSGRQAARKPARAPATGRRIKSGAKLGDAYQERGLPVTKPRLYQAGAWLAWVLNRACGRSEVESRDGGRPPTLSIYLLLTVAKHGLHVKNAGRRR